MFEEENVLIAAEVSKLYRREAASIPSHRNYSSSNFTDSKCYQHVSKIRNDLALRLPYASFVDDSNGKKESGLYKGNFRWLGRYYQCEGQTDRQDIKTKMCLVSFGRDPEQPSGISVGQCVPEACSQDDISELNKLLLPDNQFAMADCPQKLSYSAADIALIVILSILVFLALLGTIVEVATKKSSSSSSKIKVLKCFSVITNHRVLFNMKRKKSSIPVLDGIRFFSMSWVVLGHTYAFSLGATDNIVDYGELYPSRIAQLAIINGTLSVDSFFFLSGLLVAYLALRRMQRNGGKLNVPLMYLQRYLRLTPTLIFGILFMIGMYQRIGGGLIYQSINWPFRGHCVQWWWTNLLYINNLIPKNGDESCIPWTWYLANDMQFFIVAPIFLYLLYRFPKAGLAALGIGVLGSASITGALTRHYKLLTDVYEYSLTFRVLEFITYPWTAIPNLDIPSIYEENTEEEDTPIYWEDTYNRPWCRIGVYFIGMLTGYVLYVTKGKLKLRKVFVAALWVTVIAVELAVVYGWFGSINEPPYQDYPSYDVMAFYEAVRRPLWGFGLMWITLACTYGYGGPITPLLGWKAFIPLGRLTYSTYMVHVFVVLFMFTSREVELHMRIDIFIYYYLAALFLSILAGYVLYLLIEAPVAEMQKLALSKPRRETASTGVARRDADANPPDSVPEADSGYENPVNIHDELRVHAAVKF